MSGFKDMVARDNHGVFLNNSEFAEMRTIKYDGATYGDIPVVLSGLKEWLIKEVDLTKLQNFDIWLSQESDMPDYPYQFTMWQYTTQGVVNGIPGDANLNVSFVGYSER